MEEKTIIDILQFIVYVIIALVVMAFLGGTLALWLIWYLENTSLQQANQQGRCTLCLTWSLVHLVHGEHPPSADKSAG